MGCAILALCLRLSHFQKLRSSRTGFLLKMYALQSPEVVSDLTELLDETRASVQSVLVFLVMSQQAVFGKTLQCPLKKYILQLCLIFLACNKYLVDEKRQTKALTSIISLSASQNLLSVLNLELPRVGIFFLVKVNAITSKNTESCFVA